MTIRIRAEIESDRDAIRHVNEQAFGGPAEATLVDAIRDGEFAEVSLVAEVSGAIVGHILLSRVIILSEGRAIEALSLAPMAVLPEHQRQGIGSLLVSEAIKVCRERGEQAILVLGHPDYYPRFGFSAKLAESIESPFGGGEAWMALELVPGALTGIRGRVEFSPPFNAL
ncbi:MAG: N-acetyltransferase [Planctomycetaceae bacterium]|nr:N-acetyltransferase [Planctomycetaceae bacterium]MCB9950112.1 N-acetyltransferase [Planctomycetaceae bacterium]